MNDNANNPWLTTPAFDLRAADIRAMSSSEFRRLYECVPVAEQESLQGPWIFEPRHDAVRTLPSPGRPHGAVVARIGNHRGFVHGYAIGPAVAAVPEMIGALEIAEQFIAGFEGDELQEGVAEKLETIRRVLASAKVGLL